MAQMHVDLVSVDQKIWSGEAVTVVARTTEGELGILPGHTPLLGELVEPGEVRILTADRELAYTVNGGFLSVAPDGVSILAESATPTAAQAR